MRYLAAVPLALIVACSSATVDKTQARRVVGSESSVRVDAEIFGEELQTGAGIPITWEITNQRASTIAVADIIPVTSFDAETRTITVDIGSEVPGGVLLPRLVAIAPGETKVFTTSARMSFPMPRQTDPTQRIAPAALRLRVSFLGDVEPFRQLIDINEKAIADRELADTLFPLWIERNEVLYTGTVPMWWRGTRDNFSAQPQRPGRGRSPR